ncbi:leucyl aminopeptidase family protein [Marinicella sp. S1101]|uniref:leucyl aminopeptidase family protein n=1 Tax=Marinicella marina TaxID=2996016 RepID=UPI002260F1D8|nr:leucyl aminopeptidase family protein [Marinicella marina]MCX7553247.1 leucyl aminopeptidase family protein [Marinicella marina]MDJ1138979.1 leucyl aminopeptidase family protein [Marinicella marina]
MTHYISTANDQQTTPIIPIIKSTYETWLAAQNEFLRAVASQQKLGEDVGNIIVDRKKSGRISKVYMLVSDDLNPYDFCHACKSFPDGQYHVESDTEEVIKAVILAWGFGSYRFDRYLNQKQAPTLVVKDQGAYHTELATIKATSMVRDLINTPADDMGPTELSDYAEQFAKENHATFTEIVGDSLLSENFPSIHIVGRASHKAPRLIELNWGDENNPKISLVGKGVCFDTGGNNMKSAQFMRWMKKDMGGGAHVLGLAQLIIDHDLPVCLQVLIPAVENAVSGSAYRQGDVAQTRSGQTIEIGHTDAEGRVILADALTYASEGEPELIIDYATLTGAARVAMGPTVTPIFSNRKEISDEIFANGQISHDETWPLPLQQSYKKYIKSSIADLNNSASLPQGGCITAALFLEHFVGADIPWVHIDTYGWNFGDRTGGTEGGEALGMVAVFNWLKGKYTA